MQPLIDQFEEELSNLIDKYSDMEITCAEAVGVLSKQIHHIENLELYNRLEQAEGLLGL